MATVTLAELIERARSAADMTDDYPTREEFVRWINVDRHRLDVMIARHGMVYNVTYEDVTGAGAQSYTLTAVPLAVLAVFELDTEGRFRQLLPADAVDGRYDTTTTGTATRYRLDRVSGDTVLTLWPLPTSGTYRVYYIPTATALSLDADTVDYPLGWEEWLVLSAARRALAKEESSTAEMVRQMRELESHIETAAWDQVFAANQRVRNVDKAQRGWSHDVYFPPAYTWRWL